MSEKEAVFNNSSIASLLDRGSEDVRPRDSSIKSTRWSIESAQSAGGSKVNWTELAKGLKEKTEQRKAQAKAKELRHQKHLHGLNQGRSHNYNTQKHRCVLFFRRFKCLFWGNMFFRNRYRVVALFEMFFCPLFCFLMFLAFTRGVTWNKVAGEMRYAETNPLKFAPVMLANLYHTFVYGKLPQNNVNAKGLMKILYYPKNNFTKEIMEGALEKLGMVDKKCDTKSAHHGPGCAGVSSIMEVVEIALMRQHSKEHGSPIGVIFTYDEHTKISPQTGYPLHLIFSISTFHKEISETTDNQPFTKPPRDKNWKNPYHGCGFLGLQAAIEETYIHMLASKTDSLLRSQLDSVALEHKSAAQKASDICIMKHSNDISAVVRTLAVSFVPNFYDANARRLISTVVIIILIIGYTSVSYFIVKQIVMENHCKIKELLELHGLPRYYHWISILTHALLFRTITASLVTEAFFLDYGNGALVSHSNWVLVFVVIWTHLWSLTCFNFFVATTLRSVNFSGVYGISLCIATYAVPAALARSEVFGFQPNLILCILFPNWALENFVRVLTELECDASGLDWKNFSQNYAHLTQLTTLEIVGVFLVNGTVYLILAVLNDLFKSKSGLWYRYIERCGKIRQKKPRKSIVETQDVVIDDSFKKPRIYDEKNLETDKCHVHVRHLSKLYGKHKLVLDNISLNFAHGEITVLLGHTDSGKSTLIQCLAGLVTPTTGVALINGFNVATEVSKARQYMGLCPQEVVTFNMLTIHEHLVLCYKLRGLNSEESNHEAGELVKLLRLQDVRDKVPSEITDDEKRKLAIAMCLVDSPNVILLDEPTFGMGILHKREIWSILKELKKDGHTIILSTNMMDEAETLADRIVLLSHGKLICYGTPGYLKEQYDTGYILRITTAFKFFMEKLNAISIKHFSNTLKEHKTKAILDKDTILIDLPKHKLSKFGDFLDDLEINKYHIGIFSYSIEQVSLSDVFITVCESVSDEVSLDVYERRDSLSGEWTSTLASQLPTVQNESVNTPTCSDHFKALCRKQWIYTSSRTWVIFFEFFIPLVLILIAVLESNIFVTPIEVPNIRKLQLESFPDAVVFVQMGGTAKGARVDWPATIQAVLQNRGEELEPSIDILSHLRKEHQALTKLPGFSPEKRMISLVFSPHNLNSDSETELDEPKFDGYFSSSSLHSAPTVMNLIANILLHAIGNSPMCNMTNLTTEDYRVTVINAPFPSLEDKPMHTVCNIRCVLFAVIVSLSCGFIAATNINMPMEERMNGMKQVQIMAGVSPGIYWTSIYASSVLLYGITSLFITLIFSIDWIGQTFKDPQVKLTLLLFVALYLCWSSIPWTFFLSTIIPTRLHGYKSAMILHLCLGLIPHLFYKNVTRMDQNDQGPGQKQSSKSLENNQSWNILHFFFYLFPPYSITAAFQNWFEIASQQGGCDSFPPMINEMCNSDDNHTHANQLNSLYKFVLDNDIRLGQCCKKICESAKTPKCFVRPELLDFGRDHLRDPNLVADITSLVCQGFFYWGLLILVERSYISNLFRRIVVRFLNNNEQLTKETINQPDVRLEKQRVSAIIEAGTFDEAALVCQDLTKSYATHMVINNVNFTVKKGECVGLLGGCGSGRSTVVQMLVGQVIPTRGTAYIGSFNLQLHRKKYLRNIGYCPQMNCLFENFTGVQMMELIGRIKGLPASLLTVHVKKWLQLFGLSEAGNDKCETYSSSMKRRLCVAMALVGGNEILFFDEPTAGFDPITKQRFWSVIKQMSIMGHSIIFTTSSVDECSRLGGRLLVLSEGNVQCIGTAAELQEKFSKGFSLLIKLRYDTLNPLEIISSSVGRVVEVKKNVESVFRHATLRDEQDNLLLYFIRDISLTWGQVFRKAESIKSTHDNILDSYYISKATLEDVFILLTNKFRELDKPRRMDTSVPGEMTKFEVEKAAYDAATKKAAAR